LELRVLREHATRDVDLLELHAGIVGRTGNDAIGAVRLVGSLARDVDGPELAAHAALLQPCKVRVTWRPATQIVGIHVHRMHGVLADAPRQIVMSVDHRLSGEYALRTREIWIGGGGTLRLLRTECSRHRERRGGDKHAEDGRE